MMGLGCPGACGCHAVTPAPVVPAPVPGAVGGVRALVSRHRVLIIVAVVVVSMWFLVGGRRG